MILAEAIPAYDTVPTALISAAAMVVVAFITVWGKDKLNKPKKPKQVDAAYDRLEKLADRLQTENDKLTLENDRLQDENTVLRIENANLKRGI